MAEKDKKNIKKIDGKPIIKKKGLLSKFKEDFIEEDSSTVKEYLINEVILPNVKDALSTIVRSATDTASSTVDMFLYGNSAPKRNKRYSNGSRLERVSYGSFYDGPKKPKRSLRERSRSYFDDEIILESKDLCIEVISTLEDVISRYSVATVADLNEIINADGEWTDHNYGWTSMSGATHYRVREGWRLVLPKAIPLENR